MAVSWWCEPLSHSLSFQLIHFFSHGPRATLAQRTVKRWNLFRIKALQLRELLGLYKKRSERSELFVLFFQRLVDIWNEKLCRVRFDDLEELAYVRSRICNTTYFPFIQPERGRFVFDFSVPDQRLATNILLLLTCKEKMSNLYEPSCVRMDGSVDPLPQGVPRGLNKFRHSLLRITMHVFWRHDC